METRSQAAASASASAVIDLTLSDDECDYARKPSAAKKTKKIMVDSDIIDLLSDDEDDGNAISRQSLKRKHQQEEDAKIASVLFSREESQLKSRQEREMKALRQSPLGNSILLVESVVALIKPFASKKIYPVGKDDAVFLAEKFLSRQATFKKQKKPFHVQLAYHFTQRSNLDKIRTDGLLTIEDRFATSNENTKHVAFFVDGIYVGTNPFAFTKYGTVGLMVAILKGTKQSVGKRSKPIVSSAIDTVIGNKTGDSPYCDEIILRQSSQVLPLVQFERKHIESGDAVFAHALWAIHEKLQGLLDENCNGSAKTSLTRVAGKPVLSANTPRPGAKTKKVPVVPKTRSRVTVAGSLIFSAPNTLESTTIETPFSHVNRGKLSPSPEECPICLDDMVCKDVVKLNTCTHCFHKACILPIVSPANNALCPVCRACTKEPKGKSPSGRLHIYTAPRDCAGVPHGLRSIAINYRMSGGIQKAYDPQPGAPFQALANHTAVVPNNPAGRDLLKRIVYAFRRGLSFAVFLAPSRSTAAVASATTYKTGTLHKLTVNATLQSWSDPTYFKRCHDQLDLLKVPPARALELPTEICTNKVQVQVF